MIETIIHMDSIVGKRFHESNQGKALEKLEEENLIPINSIQAINARIDAPEDEKIWEWMSTNTTIYNVVDYKGRFGSKKELVNLVAHSYGPLSSSQGILKALKTEFTHRSWTARIDSFQEDYLLSGVEAPIFHYHDFLKLSEDPNFLEKHPKFGVVRKEVDDKSSFVILSGGVNRAQRYLQLAREKYKTESLSLKLNPENGGRIFVLGDGYEGLCGYDLIRDGRYVGVNKKDFPNL